MLYQPNGKSGKFLEIAYPRQKLNQFKRHQHSLISDFLDLAHLSLQEEAALATNWIKGRPEELKIQNLALATMTGPDVQHTVNKCESLGSRKQWILSREIFPAYGSPSTSFLPNMHFQCCVLLQGTLGGDFDIFAASGESTAWVLLWRTHSRLIGVRVCPVALFDLFSTAFDPREWTVVVFWKEDLRRQSQLNTLENEGGDETSSPSPPRFTFFDDPDIPLGLLGLVDFLDHLLDLPPGAPGPSGPPGHPPGWSPTLWPTAPPPPGEGEKVRTGNASRARSRPRSPLPEPQLIPFPMSDGDDDQPQDGRQRQRSRSRDRVHPHAQAPQEPQIQPMVIQEPLTVLDEDPAITVSRTIAVSGASEHLHIHLHMLASSPNRLHLLPESSRSSL